MTIDIAVLCCPNLQWKMLTYLKYAFPSIQAPLIPIELADSHSLSRVPASRQPWCSDASGRCCCDSPIEWHLRGHFLEKAHARDFTHHALTALPTEMMLSLNAFTAPISAGTPRSYLHMFLLLDGPPSILCTPVCLTRDGGVFVLCPPGLHDLGCGSPHSDGYEEEEDMLVMPPPAWLSDNSNDDDPSDELPLEVEGDAQLQEAILLAKKLKSRLR
jgi:hypothetical protein